MVDYFTWSCLSNDLRSLLFVGTGLKCLGKHSDPGIVTSVISAVLNPQQLLTYHRESHL